MESATEPRRELESAIADTRRRIAASQLREGSGFPINGVQRDRNLGKLRQTLNELEQALSNLSADDA
jgi:hypothetical protein